MSSSAAVVLFMCVVVCLEGQCVRYVGLYTKKEHYIQTHFGDNIVTGMLVSNLNHGNGIHTWFVDIMLDTLVYITIIKRQYLDNGFNTKSKIKSI